MVVGGGRVQGAGAYARLGCGCCCVLACAEPHLSTWACRPAVGICRSATRCC